eukprot:TRINITY_DN13206_c0_g1_i1.p1 TRINITY_DN13206_c0_g1~~TRINITY_DN13206_c0_g1_i1.p1  ORF type:complete len:225 (+),score=69.85 TRINITY_DN13206_c0_g1_i1:120-794(+)
MAPNKEDELIKEVRLQEAQECKEKGNKRFQAKDDAGALRLYAEGLSILGNSVAGKGEGPHDAPPLAGHVSHFRALCMDPVSPEDVMAAALHANSAMALLRQRRWLEAIEHSNATLRHDPSNVKAPWRGATAAMEAGMREVAVAFVENGLEQHPKCRELTELRRKLGCGPEAEDNFGLGPLGGCGLSADAGSETDEDIVVEKFKAMPNWTLPVKKTPPPGKDKAD